MKKDEFIKLLIESLRESVVRKCIKNISVEEAIDNKISDLKEDTITPNRIEKEKEAYLDKIKLLENKSLILEQQLCDVHKEKKALEEANKKLLKRIQVTENLLQTSNNTMQHYVEHFETLNIYYNNYISLGESVHRELENVIKVDCAENFLCSGTQWDNLEPLWDFISYKLDEYNDEKINKLIGIFEYLFERYNSVTKIYSLLETQEGEELDEDLHTRASNSLVTGTISKVLLRGYKNIRTDRVIKKSMVRVS